MSLYFVASCQCYRELHLFHTLLTEADGLPSRHASKQMDYYPGMPLSQLEHFNDLVNSVSPFIYQKALLLFFPLEGATTIILIILRLSVSLRSMCRLLWSLGHLCWTCCMSFCTQITRVKGWDLNLVLQLSHIIDIGSFTAVEEESGDKYVAYLHKRNSCRNHRRLYICLPKFICLLDCLVTCLKSAIHWEYVPS